MRSCVSCRARRLQAELLRFQLRDGLITRSGDGNPVLAGRSIYLCRDRRCLAALLKRRELSFRNSKYAKIIVRLNAVQAARLVRAFKGIDAE